MDKEHPQLPAAITQDHECPDCGSVYLDACTPPVIPPDPVEYARAVVVAGAGLGASYTLYRLVEVSLYMMQHGMPGVIDLNVVVAACTAALGSIMGWAFAKRKQDND